MKRALSLAYLAALASGAERCGQAVGDACRAAFARDELSEDDDAVARRMYAGEARETAMTLMKHQNSKSARRFRRLREELSSRTAGGRDL